MYQNDYQKKRRAELPEYISIIGPRNYAKIRIDEIEIIEQEGRKLHIVTAGKDYSFYGKLEMIVNSLAERAFFSPMKSIVINLDHIKDISCYSVNFRSGQSLAMGKNALAATKRAYKKYLMKYPPYTVWEPILYAEDFVAEAAAEFESLKEMKAEKAAY